jgi:cell division protein FtsB
MAMTNAEKQAEHRERQKRTVADLAAANATLLQEIATLRSENQALKDRVHALEIKSLKASIKAAKG